MSEEKPSQPKLPPTSALDNLSSPEFENWFEYPVRVQPHHTDYAGLVWHGSYIAWMEEARSQLPTTIRVLPLVVGN